MQNTLTYLEMIKIYGYTEVTFFRYYKYTFTFVADLSSGERIIVDVGGDSDSIYRMEIDTNPVKIKDLEGIDYFRISRDFVVIASYSR